MTGLVAPNFSGVASMDQIEQLLPSPGMPRATYVIGVDPRTFGGFGWGRFRGQVVHTHTAVN